jgi:8-oxo-dGTP pyrophosphatase MutT (NUDIX family)
VHNAVVRSLVDSHPLFPRLAAHLRENPGRVEDTDGEPARAAVAIVLRSTPPEPDVRQDAHHASRITHHAIEVLLILRADRTGDPWSGQVALPGGRRDPSDATLQDTAVRETLEETGIDLATDGLVLGTLDELRPRTPHLPPIIVTPYVAIVRPDPTLQISDELADAFWAPWSIFADPGRTDERTINVRGADWQVASYLVGERIVWGMTERMLRQLAQIISTL